MTRDEYDAIPFEEAKVEFHRDIPAGVTYVTMNWSGEPFDEHTSSDEGVKFIVSNHGVDLVRPHRSDFELDRAMIKSRLADSVIISVEQARALAEWSAATLRLHGCSGYGPKFDAAMDVAHAIRGRFGPSDDELLEKAKADGIDSTTAKGYPKAEDPA